MDEAAEACTPAVFGQSPPRELAGRAAWMFARRGDMVTAIARMVEVVKQWPDYYWGWEMIAEWRARQRNFRQSLEAARVLARLAPRSTTPLHYIANAQLKLGEKNEAVETLRTAFELEPADGFSGYRIFDLQLEARELGAAEKTLALLELHLPGGRTAACRVRLHCRARNKPEALAGLAGLCRSGESETDALQEAAKAVVKAGWRRDAEKLFIKALDQPGVNPEAAALWVESFVARDAWRQRKRVLELDPATPTGRAGWFAYLGALGEKKKAAYLRVALRRRGAALRVETACWGQAGYALASNSRFKQTAEWMGDWRSRADAQPWMLFNAVLAYRHIGNDAEAREIGVRALTLRGDHTTQIHQTWLACDDAAAGRFAAARARVAKVSADQLKGNTAAAYALASAILAVEAAQQQERKAVYRRHRRILAERRYQASLRARSLRRLARKGAGQMASLAGVHPFWPADWSWLFAGGTPLHRFGRVAVVFLIVIAISQLLSPKNPPGTGYTPAPPNPAPSPSPFALQPGLKPGEMILARPAPSASPR
jgi:hypothetical protein